MYWKIPLTVVILIVVGLITFSIFRKKGVSDIKKMFKVTKESYEEQIKVLNFEHEKEKALREVVQAEYDKRKKEIQTEYDKESRSLDKQKKKELEKLVVRYRENPDELTKKIAEEFGINYVKN